MKDNVKLCKQRLGGGTILVGDALNPARPVPGQTGVDRALMLQLFSEPPTRVRKKSRVRGALQRAAADNGQLGLDIV